MTASRKAVRSLASFGVGRRKLYIVPVRGIAYAAASAIVATSSVASRNDGGACRRVAERSVPSMNLETTKGRPSSV